MALMEKKKYRGRRAQRRTFRKRRRTGLYVFVGLVVLALGWLGYLGVSSALSGGGDVQRVEPPVVERPPEVVSKEPAAEARAEEEAARQRAAEEEAARQQAAEEEAAAQRAEEEAAAAPQDPTMYLTVPALGIQDVPVINDASEYALEAGTQHVPNTGFPWQSGSNTYIAGHRIGYPGSASDHVFYNLPALQGGEEVILTDSNGTVYTYRVSEVLAVTPFDSWVMNPIPGRDVVSLQTCTESVDDWWTIGPNLMSSGPESGRVIVRADRVA